MPMPSLRLIAVALLACLLAQPAFAGSKDVPLKKGAELVKVRAALLKAGWQPVVADWVDNEGAPANQSGQEGFFYRAGYIEIELCSEGVGYCIFNYRRGSECLQLTTEGSLELYKGRQYPLLYRWSNECFHH